MKATNAQLQRNVGLGGFATILALLGVGFPIWLGLDSTRTVARFFLDPTALVLFFMLILFGVTAFAQRRASRVLQVMSLIAFGLFTLANAVPGALTGLSIAGIGFILAAHFGLFQTRTRTKVVAATAATLAALAIQAIIRTTQGPIGWTALQFSYNAVGAVGLAVGYSLVLRDASLSANRRQQELQQAIDEKTQDLQQEVESRKAAEHAAMIAAETSKALAVERLELLRELHHRARNSLQITLTLLEMTDFSSPTESAETINRVRAIGLVYDLIDAAESLSAISLREYIERLIGHIQMSSEYGPVEITFEAQHDHTTRIESTINCGLMLHEIIVLICTHAFGLRPGVIEMTYASGDGKIIVTMSHHGGRIPGDLDVVSGEGSKMGLLPAFAERLHANIQLDTDGTTKWTVEIPESVMCGSGS
jgi:two-component sensor histidine kinase